MVWPDRRDKLGETCARHGLAGIWYCRQCGKSGDTIAFLMEADGQNFKSALAELGIEGSARRGPGRRTPRSSPRPDDAPVLSHWPITAENPAIWQAYATKLHAESREHLPQNPQALAWLAARGLSRAAVDRYRLGFLPGEHNLPGRYRGRSALGLSPASYPDGRPKPSIFIPRGIVIPHFDALGRVVRLRLRRPKPDTAAGGKKYLVLEGSGSQPMLLAPSGPEQLAAYVIVEAELDALLIHHATGGAVGAFAALTNRGKPDPSQHAVLREAAALLIALDYDPREVTRPDGETATETPGGTGAAWWTATYPNARRWPTPTGKDPGDAFAEGVDIRAWIAAGLPASISLPDAADPRRANIAHDTSTCQNISRNGTLEPFSPGTEKAGGAGEAAEGPPRTTRTSAKKLPPAVSSAAAPSIPPAIQALAAAWARIPGFTVTKRPDGCAFHADAAWTRASPENWEALCRFQDDLMRTPDWWNWVDATHQAATVTLDNLLRPHG